MAERRTIRIEGYTPEEILSFPNAEIEALALHGNPLVIRVGSAEVLGRFTMNGNRLVVELAHIDGGGEGALPALWILVEKYARKQNLATVEWIVHAVNCARPNLKLRRVLERRGFAVEDMPGVGAAYHQVHDLVPLGASEIERGN